MTTKVIKSAQPLSAALKAGLTPKADINNFTADGNPKVEDLFHPDAPPAPKDYGAHPLMTLRAALEGTSDVGEIVVPSAEELVALDPPLQSFLDGTVDQQYEELSFHIAGEIEEIDAQLAGGAMSSQDLRALQTRKELLIQARVQIRQEQAKIPGITANARATKEQELELLRQYGKEIYDQVELPTLTPEDLDLDGDGRVGYDYIVASRTLEDGEVEFAVVDAEMKTLRFDMQGYPLTANSFNPNYMWDLTESTSDGLNALSLPTSEEDQKDYNLVVTVPSEYTDTRNAYQDSKHLYQTNFDVPAAEGFWVLNHANGEPWMLPEGSRYKEVYAPDPLSGKFGAPPAEERSKYTQVKVAEIVISSKKHEPSAGDYYTENADHEIQFKDSDGNILYAIKVVGKEVPASDLSITFSNGDRLPIADDEDGNADGEKNTIKMRQSPIKITGDSYISTGAAGVFMKDGAKYPYDESLLDGWGNRDAKTYSLMHFGNTAPQHIGLDGWDNGIERNRRTGYMVMGLDGQLGGSDFNTVFAVPPKENIEMDHAFYDTVIEGGQGYNVVLMEEGNLYASNITHLEKQGDPSDITHVTTPGVIVWEDLFDNGDDATKAKKQGKVVKRNGDNPPVYIKVVGGQQTFIDNGIEQAGKNFDGTHAMETDGPDGTAGGAAANGTSAHADDVYDVAEAGEVRFVHVSDIDVGSKGKMHDDVQGLKDTRKEVIKELWDAIAEKAVAIPEGSFEEEIAFAAVNESYYDQSMSSIHEFFAGVNKQMGYLAGDTDDLSDEEAVGMAFEQ